MMKQILVLSALLATFCDGRYSFQKQHGSYLGKKENHFSHKLPGKSFMSVSTSHHHPPAPPASHHHPHPQPHPVDCEWSEWKISSECSVTCGSGTQTWTRHKIEHKPHYQHHHHHHADELNHYDHHHYDHNDHHGHKKRSAHGWKKTYHAPVGKECIGEPTKIETCHMKPCPIDCELSRWSEWSECPSCGEPAQSTRIRDIIKEPQYGGFCDTNRSQVKDCNNPKCPVNCELNEWTEWSECPSCGKPTTSTRERTIHKESKYGGTCDTNRTQTRDCNPPKCPNALPSFIYLGQDVYDTPVINVTFPRYFLDTESPSSGRIKRSTSDRLRNLTYGIEFKKEYENREAIEKYGAIDTMILGKFPPAVKRNISDVYIGYLAREGENASVTATINQEGGYVEFSIFSDRNVGTNLFIWFYGNGTVRPIDEPFANGEVDEVDNDKIDGDIDGDIDNDIDVISAKREKRQDLRNFEDDEFPQSARLQVKVAYDESFKAQMKGNITKIEKYWMDALAHLQVLYCRPSFKTKVEVEWVDDMLHYKRSLNGANEAVDEDQKNFTFENLKNSNADLVVYMALDNTTTANTKDDTIGRAFLGAACNSRRNAYSVNEWNEHTHYFGGIVAHEIAHNMGIKHDFKKNGRTRSRCDVAGNEESIMAYKAKKNQWSKCSTYDFSRAYNLNKNKWCMNFEINENRCKGIRERKPRIEIIGPTFNYATGEIAPGEIIIHNNTDKFDPAVEIAGGINRLYSDSAGNITIF